MRTAGANSLRSGAVNDTEASCLVLAVSLPANTRVRFSLRTSSQGQHDRLAFFADDQTVISNFSAPDGSVTKDWTSLERSLTSNVSNLTWCYLKNAADSTGDDSGWVDELSFTLPFSVCPALDMSDDECALITGTTFSPPEAPWTVNSLATEGASSLLSPDVGDGQQSCLILNVSLPDRTLVQFSRRVNSQPADELHFSIDGVPQNYRLRPAATTVLRDWSREVHILFVSGDKILRWCYVKDASGAEGTDNARLDDLSLVAPPAAPLNRDLVCLVLDMSLEDCELITSVASEPASPAWYISYFNSEGGFSNGETSLRSDPAVTHNQTSCLVLGITLPSNRIIRFFPRTDSEGGNDFVYFEADGIRLVENFSAASGSSLRAFEEVNVLLSGGVRTLKWCYTKNGSDDAGDDSGWLDRLSFSAVDDLATIALTRGLLCQALDLSAANCALIDSVAADPSGLPWVLSTTATEGGTSLRSGDIDDDETSCLVLGISLPEDFNLRFSLRADSEAVNDFLYFAVDGTRLVDTFTAAEGSTLRDWEQLSFFISDSSSTLTWCYTKNDSTSAGEDSGWLDALTFTENRLTKEQLCAALDLLTANCNQITGISTTPPSGLTFPEGGSTITVTSVPWFVSPVSIERATSLRSGDIEHNQASCLVLSLAASPPSDGVLTGDDLIEFSLRTSSQGFFDRLVFAVGSQPVISNFSAPEGDSVRNWQQRGFVSHNQVARKLSWCYVKDSRTSEGDDSGWLDALSFSIIISRNSICEFLDMEHLDCIRLTIGGVTTLPRGLEFPQEGAFATVATAVPWRKSNPGVASRGTGSMQSGNTYHTRASCLVLTAILSGIARVNFKLRTSSEGRYDRLAFFMDNQTVLRNFSAPEGSTAREWEQQSFAVTKDDVKLIWCYLKNGDTRRGEDSGWLDELSFTPTSPVCPQLDMSREECALITGTRYEPSGSPWSASSIATEGTRSLRSRDISDSQQSCLILNVSLPDRTLVQFSRRVSSQPADELYFSVDNVRQEYRLRPAATTVLRDWSREVQLLESGDKVLRWCYVKDSSGNEGDDRAWIDDLSLVALPAAPLNRELVCLALDISADDCALITSVAAAPSGSPWSVSTTATEGSYSLRSADIDDSESSCLVLGIALPGDRTIRFFLRTNSEGGNDFVYFEADGVRLVETFSAAPGSSFRDFEQLEVVLSGSVRTLKWCYTKNGDTDDGEDSAWLDRLSFNTVSDLSSIALTRGLVCQALDLNTDHCALIDSVTAAPTELPWVLSSTATQGSLSLRSAPDIDDAETSCLVLGITLSDDRGLIFSLRTDSEAVNDFLYFEADGTRLVDRFSAPQGSTRRDWEQLDVLISDSTRTLKWCYTKNGSTSSGADGGWLDALIFTEPGVTKVQLCTALDMSAGDCALITGISSLPPPGLLLAQQATGVPWVLSSTATKGDQSLRSGDIDDNQASCLALGVTLPAGTLIRFSLRTDSEAANDFLQFTSDSGTLLDNFSATNGSLRDWEQLEYSATNNIKTLSWCYLKNGTADIAEDSGWLDALSVTIPLTTEDVCPALDLSTEECTLITAVTADPPASPWLISSTATEGDSSLRSADIDDSESSCLVLGLSLSAATLIRFSLRTDSEAVNDHLSFAAGGQELIERFAAAEGATLRDWEPQQFLLPVGNSTLRWCYNKNDSTSAGEDRGWLDALSFAEPVSLSTTQLCTALDLSADNCSQIQSVSSDPPFFPWRIATDTSVAGGSSLRSATIGDNQQSCLVLGLSLSAATLIRFSLRTDSEAVNDHLSFAAGGQELIETFAAAEGDTLRDWEPQQFLLPVGNSTLRWCYNKNDSTSAGEDRGWLDALSYVPAAQARIEQLCEALDLFQNQCATIRSVTYNPPQTPWLTTATESARGGLALVSPVLGSGESSCLTVEFYSPLTPDSPVVFDWRTTSPSEQDILQFQVGDQQSQIEGMSEWQTETVMIDSAQTTMGWCYSQNSAADGQTARGWLDNLSVLTLTDRYTVQIAVIPDSVQLTEASDGFRFQVAVTAVSETLPPPTDWVLVIAGMDNIAAADTTYALVFSDGAAQIAAIATFADPLLPSSILLSLEDRPSLINTTGTSLAFQLPAVRRLETLEIITSTSVTQSTPDAAIVIAVTVSATDNFGEPFEPTGLTLLVEDSGNADVSQSNYPLSFVDGSAAATITVGLTRRGDVGSIELSVVSGDIQSTVSITLNPAPRILVSITLSAASSKLAQTTANTAVSAVLMFNALDNYGDPIDAGEISLQIEATNAAIVAPSLTVAIATTATALQMIEILPQNDLDTTVTVSILRGTLDESVQLLPDGGIQIAVRALRVLRQLQLGLVDQVSLLQQVDRTLPIHANIRLIGLDQYGQPSAFLEVMLTAAAEPTTTEVTLNPQQLSATGPEGAQTLLEVTFPEASRMETTITISIEGQGAGVTTNSLVVQARPDLRDPLQPLHVDAAETGVTELDLIVALRWLIDQQGSTASLVVNLTIPSTSVTTAGIENLRQLFTESDNLNRIDLNGDKRADQLDLRILLRWLSGLRGTALTEQETFTDLEGIIQLLLGSEP